MGNDIRFGLEINNGHIGVGVRDHIHPQYQQPQWDPITLEARQIAGELDRGETHRAAEHLSRDLQQMPDFRDQKRLVETIDMMDVKNRGADIHLGRLDRYNGVWDDIHISPPRYYEGGGRGVPMQPGYGRPGYRAPEVDVRIDLNIFKNGGRR